MPKTYAQLQHEIQALQKQAEAIREEEIRGVIKRIKEAISSLGLTAADLGFGGSPTAQPMVAQAPSRRLSAPGKSSQAGTKVPPKYRDGAGNEWMGRGMKPRWLVAALGAGSTLDTFAILARPSAAFARTGKPAPAKAKAKTKAKGKVKFKDAAGNTWSGRGPMPGWLKTALASGKTLAQLAA
jgi:DNA-binding protein H-NS